MIPYSTRISISLISALIFVVVLIDRSDASPHICTRRVAIVGGGIGGSSAAYLLAKEIQAEHKCQPVIEIFEREDRLGGRIESFDYDGMTFELGADVWSAKVNTYIDQLAQEAKVPVAGYDVESDSRRAEPTPKSLADPIAFEKTVVWEGKPGQFTPFTLSELGVNTLRTAASMELFKYHLMKNYEFRDTGNRPFRSLQHFLRQGADMSRYMSTSTLQELSNEVQVPRDFIEENIVPIVRVIYEQNSETNAFAGLVSLISNDEVRHVRTGNQRLVEVLAKESGATIRMSTHVVKIAHTSHSTGTTRYTLEWKDASEKRYTGEYDTVFIAAPAEYLDLEAPLPGAWQPNRAYVHKAVTFVRAAGLNTAFWGFEADAILSTANATHQGVPFYSVVARDVAFTNGEKMYKIFSPAPLSTATIAQYFAPGYQVIRSKTWRYTFTKLDPIELDKLPPFELAPSLYHISSIDTITVAMEGSVLAARNAVRLWLSHVSPHTGSTADCCTDMASYYAAVLSSIDAVSANGTLLEKVICTVYAPILPWYLQKAKEGSALPTLLTTGLKGAVYGMVLMYWGVASKSPLGQNRAQPWGVVVGVLALITTQQYWLERELLSTPILGPLIRARFFGISEQIGAGNVGGVVLPGAELLAGLMIAAGLYLHRSLLPASAIVIRPLFRKDLLVLVFSCCVIAYAAKIRDSLFLMPLAGLLTRASTGTIKLASSGLSWLDLPLDASISVSISITVVVLVLLWQTRAGILLVVPAFVLALSGLESAITGVGQSLISGGGVLEGTIDPFGIVDGHQDLYRTAIACIGVGAGGLMSWLAAGSSPVPSAMEDEYYNDDGYEVLPLIKRTIGTLLIVVGMSVSQASIWTLIVTYVTLAVLVSRSQ